jgi:hypothetical protein
MSLLSTDQLNQIKESLEQKMNESDESEYTPSDSENSCSSSLSDRKKKYKNINYKSKYNQSESRYRYLQLEMSNKNIEINELKDKLLPLDKYNLIVKNINFLFERLDNAIKGLNERITLIDDNNLIKYKTLDVLESTKAICNKTIDKYDMYINTSIYPLFNDEHSILKESLTSFYVNKQKEFETLLLRIKNKHFKIRCTNIIRIISIILIILLIMNLILLGIYLFIW